MLLLEIENKVHVFDRHIIHVPSFDLDVHYESYSCFGKQLRFTEESVMLNFANDFVSGLPDLKVFGMRMIFCPQAALGVYIYSATKERDIWQLPSNGSWHIPET